jgi:hypothetical protein
VDDHEAKALEQRILNRDRSVISGMVRASFGIYNTKEEINVLCEALESIAEGRYLEGYRLNRERGEYIRDDFNETFERFIKL